MLVRRPLWFCRNPQGCNSNLQTYINPNNFCFGILWHTSYSSSLLLLPLHGALPYVPLPDTEMAATQPNALLSAQKSDSGLEVALHPLVLLTISDYITRHTLRNQTGPIIGALLGQQNGREVTVEHAFECKVLGDSVDTEWFMARLQQSTLFFSHNPTAFVYLSSNNLQ
jgi:hypothetical protein